jgi:hypothetical protein
LREEKLVEDWCFELNLESEGWLGNGEWGNAYSISSNQVIKITRDYEEFICAYSLLNQNTDYNVKILGLRVFPTGKLGILMEHVNTDGIEDTFSELKSFTDENDLDIFDAEPDEHGGQLSDNAIKMSNDLYLAYMEIAKHGYSGAHSLDIHHGNIGINSLGNYALFDQRDKSNPIFDDFDLFNKIKDTLSEDYIINEDDVKPRIIPIEKILVDKDAFENTLRDITCQKYSKTDEPIECMYNADGNIQVNDGYHRLCEALLDGKSEVEVAIYYDERCGYAHQTYSCIKEEDSLEISSDLLFGGLENYMDEESLQDQLNGYIKYKSDIKLKQFIKDKKSNDEIIEQVEEYVVYNSVKRGHREADDFSDGDLGERLEEFKYYNLTKDFDLTKLNRTEWDLDENLVSHYEEMILEKGTDDMPKIVIDDNLSIIDGMHRINALLNSGITKSDIYVGTNEKIKNKNKPIIKIS